MCRKKVLESGIFFFVLEETGDTPKELILEEFR